jgi:2-hydroxycyclohexanecarboxyl-CoA dehydrogenase
MTDMNGKRGIVTGGAGGIGSAIARRIISGGGSVAIFDRNGAAAEALATELRAGGCVAEAYAVDITDYDLVEQATESVSRAGPISFLVHAAGWDAPKPFLATQPAEWKLTLDINLVGALNLHHVICQRMKASGGGRIVNFASDAARAGASNCTVYSAAKAGLIAFTKSLARELAADGILLNTICPGPTETALFDSMAQSGEAGERFRAALTRGIPLGRIAVPDDYAEIVMLLLGSGGSYITGQTISVSGGLTMM